MKNSNIDIVNNKIFLVRFPNETEFYEIPLDINLFESNKEFDNEIFGWYAGSYISIKK